MIPKNDRDGNGFFSITALMLLVLFGLYGCAILPTASSPPEPGVEPVDYSPPQGTPKKASGPAVSLYIKSQKSIKEGKWEQAEVQIERALRIEPSNGYYWHTLALIKFERGEYGQTIQLCRKSKSLAVGDVKLLNLNESLLRRIP